MAAIGRRLLRHPGRIAAACAVTLTVGSVLWNTLFHQSTRHPAPLFGGAQPVAPPRVAAAPIAPPLPMPRPDATTVGSLGPSRPIEAASAKPAGPDPIGGLIRAIDSGAKPAPDLARLDGARPDGARIAAAQKALTKLGYGPLKPDGMFGASTRQALERFERDRSLPVTGALAGRTVRQLAQISGVNVQ